jgi:hypothetical protein
MAENIFSIVCCRDIGGMQAKGPAICFSMRNPTKAPGTPIAIGVGTLAPLAGGSRWQAGKQKP